MSAECHSPFDNPPIGCSGCHHLNQRIQEKNAMLRAVEHALDEWLDYDRMKALLPKIREAIDA